MKITYSGKPEALTPAETRKIDSKFGKLAKLLDKRDGEREAHVIYNKERHVHNAEVRVRYGDHELFGAGQAADSFTAMSEALEKLEKQILKVRTKRRDTKRGPKEEEPEEVVAPIEEPKRTKAAPLVAETSEPRIFRVDHHERRKPMTLDEAILEIEPRDYVVYRDAVTDRVTVLIRRRDGNFDLIEA